MREKLSWLLAHPDEVRRMGEESAGFICGKYDWDDVTKRTVTLYERAAGRLL